MTSPRGLALQAGIAVVACVAVGAAAAHVPILAIALVSMPLFVRFPWLALLGTLLLHGTRGALVANLPVESAQLTAVQYGLLLLGGFGAALASVRRPLRGAIVSLALLGVVALPGIVFPVLGQSTPTRLLGVFILVAPILACVIGYVSSTRGVHLVAWAGVGVLVINALESIRQYFAGTSALITEGYDYGTTVREIDGRLRTFGFTVTNADLGSLVAATALLPVVARLSGRPIPRLVEWIAYVASATCLFLSTSRSSLLFVIVCMLLLAGQEAIHQRRRLVAVVVASMAAVGMVFAFSQAGAGSAQSVLARLDIWQGLIDRYGSFSGLGPGAVGAASYSSVNESGIAIFVDNSWLSIFLQYGIVGVVTVGAGLLYVTRHGHRISKIAGCRRAGRIVMAVVIAGALAGMVIEFLDYVVASALCGFCVGIALSQGRSCAPIENPESETRGRGDGPEWHKNTVRQGVL